MSQRYHVLLAQEDLREGEQMQGQPLPPINKVSQQKEMLHMSYYVAAASLSPSKSPTRTCLMALPYLGIYRKGVLGNVVLPSKMDTLQRHHTSQLKLFHISVFV